MFKFLGIKTKAEQEKEIKEQRARKQQEIEAQMEREWRKKTEKTTRERRAQAIHAGITPNPINTLKIVLNEKTSVEALTVLPDGRLVSGHTYANKICIWNLNTQHCEIVLTDISSVRDLTVLLDGRLVSGGNSGACVWDLKAKRPEIILSDKTGSQPSNCVFSLSLLYDGRLVAGCSEIIRIWNVETKICDIKLIGHTNNVWSLVALPDGRLASASWDKTVRIWNIEAQSCEMTLERHRGEVHCLALLSDRYLASGGHLSDNTICIWDIQTGVCEKILNQDRFSYPRYESLLGLPDGRLIAHGSSIIQVWGNVMRSPKIDATIELGEYRCAHSLTLLPNGNVASGGGYHDVDQIRLWNVGLQLPLDFESEFKKKCRIYAEHNMPIVPTIIKPTSSNLLNFLVISFTELTISNKILGEGSFGIVYQGKWQLDDVAIKKLKILSLSDVTLASFQKEAQRHGALQHPNIVKLFGVCMEHGHYSMIMELMVMGSLYDVLHSSKDILWPIRISIAQQIAIGLSYLHQHNIFHRDLKSMNVLLDNNMVAKLSDFGLSKNVKLESATSTTARQTLGTLLWMAPELLARGAKHSEASDIYALGIVFWELSSRKLPFQDEENATPENIRQWIKEGERETIPAEVPSQFAALIAKCWAQRIEDRPSNCGDIVNMLSTAEQSTLSSGYKWSKGYSFIYGKFRVQSKGCGDNNMFAYINKFSINIQQKVRN